MSLFATDPITELFLALAPATVTVQDIQFGEWEFKATFEVDSPFTLDGKTFDVTAAGRRIP